VRRPLDAVVGRLVEKRKDNVEKVTQRVVDAAGKGKPRTSGVASVFDIARTARQPRKWEAFDFSTLEIRDNVPLPGPAVGPRGGALDLLAKMRSGQSVVLPERKAKTLRSAATKAKIKIAVRKLGDDEIGVWKL
jgi:hypothetical protein